MGAMMYTRGRKHAVAACMISYECLETCAEHLSSADASAKCNSSVSNRAHHPLGLTCKNVSALRNARTANYVVSTTHCMLSPPCAVALRGLQ